MKHKPIRIGDSVPLQQVALTEELDAKINVSTSNVVLGRTSAGEGPHEEILLSDLTGGSSYVSVTYTEMETLINDATLIPGNWYLITDASGTDLGFLTHAVNENTISVSGTGGYLNADFQAVGDYSNTPETFGTQQGIWQAANEGDYLQGDVVIWNLLHYQLTDAAQLNGDNPENNTSAYTLLDKATHAATYITAWDVSEYSLTYNIILSRRDSAFNNYVYGDSAIPVFQFGRSGVEGNNITFGTVDIVNYLGILSANNIKGSIGGLVSTEGTNISNNSIEGGSIQNIEFKGSVSVSYNTLYANSAIQILVLGDGSTFDFNILENGGSLTGITAGANCSISRNKIGQGATLGGGTTMGDGAAFNDMDIRANKQISNKTLGAGVTFSDKVVQLTTDETETYSANVEGSRIQPGFSDIPVAIDITGLTTLDITAAWAQYRGIFSLTSSNATESIDTITNPPTLFPFILRPQGFALTITGTAYAGIGAGQIALKATDYTLDGDKGEYIVLEIDPLGSGCLVEKYVVNNLI